MNRLNAGLRARAEERFQPFVAERSNDSLYIAALQSVPHDTQTRVGFAGLLDPRFAQKP